MSFKDPVCQYVFKDHIQGKKSMNKVENKVSKTKISKTDIMRIHLSLCINLCSLCINYM